MDLFLYDEKPAEKYDLNQKLQPESIKASSDCLKRVVPKNTIAQVPLLVLGTDEDAMISKKDHSFDWAILPNRTDNLS